jgi:hypothetical protein
MAWSGFWRAKRSFGDELQRRPPETHPDHAYLYIRSVAADGERHLMQYAVADDLGAVRLSAFVRTPSPVGDPTPQARAAVAEGYALDEDGLAVALRVCRGLRISAFGARLCRGLLPAEIAAGLAGMDCARDRFVRLARQRGLVLAPGEPAELNDARRLVGLPPERERDAALRALALRGLCHWMDGRDARAEPRSFVS